MGEAVKSNWRKGGAKSQRGSEETPLVRWLLIGVAMSFSAVFLLLPLINVFAQAFVKGWRFYLESLRHPDTLAAIRLTLTVAAISVPLNLVFGLAAAWAIAKFEFSGKAILITLSLAVIGTVIIAYVVRAIVGLRPVPEVETAGLNPGRASRSNSRLHATKPQPPAGQDD